MDEQKLEEMYTLTKDNNRMLRAMRRSAFIGGVIKFIFWIVVLFVIPYFLWLYIQPYLETIMGTYGAVQDQANNFGSLNLDWAQIQEALKRFGAGRGQ